MVLLAAASDIVAHASRLAVSAGWVPAGWLGGWLGGCARALPPRFYVAHSAVSIPCNIYIYIYIDHIYIYIDATRPNVRLLLLLLFLF